MDNIYRFILRYKDRETNIYSCMCGYASFYLSLTLLNHSNREIKLDIYDNVAFHLNSKQRIVELERKIKRERDRERER